MDPSGRIYIATEDAEAVDPRDAARLDGYLRGRAETDAREAVEAEVARLRDLTKQYEDRLSPAKVGVTVNDALAASADREKPMDKTRALARLRQATWEASQFLSLNEVGHYVETVLDEIRSDAP